MNIHPLFVHFPIAFLVLYSFFEIVRIRSWQKTPWIAPLKIILVCIGTVFAYTSLFTGELAEHALQVGDDRILKLVETHSSFATFSTYIFLVLAITYVVEYFFRTSYVVQVPKSVQKVLRWYSATLGKSWVRIALAFLGAIGIFFTGALGAAIVYGPATDPFVWFAYRLMFPF